MSHSLTLSWILLISATQTTRDRTPDRGLPSWRSGSSAVRSHPGDVRANSRSGYHFLLVRQLSSLAQSADFEHFYFGNLKPFWQLLRKIDRSHGCIVYSNKSVDEGVRHDKDFFCGGFKEILKFLGDFWDIFAFHRVNLIFLTPPQIATCCGEGDWLILPVIHSNLWWD